jgi:hypothetical protein
MSCYCTKTDILADFKNIKIDSTTSVTPSSLNEIIEQESNYIDARIGVRYVVPIVEATYPVAFSLLKRICIFRVSDRVRNILEIKTGVTQKDSDEKYKDNNVRTPSDDLEMIAKGDLLLPGVPLVTANAGVNSFNVDTCVQHVFDTSKQQW